MSVVENARNQLVSSGSWSVDPVHSTVEFRVKHMMIQTVRGRFRDFDGAIVAGDEPSVSPDFFDAERYPVISFRSDRVHFNGEDSRFALAGELTIKGVTRPITLDGELQGAVAGIDGGDRMALALRGQLDRSDYGLVWNRVLETGGVLVGDTVDLLLDVAAVRVD